MYSKFKDTKKRYEKKVDESNNIGFDESFKVKENQRAEYDSWGYIYSEINIVRQEIMRLGLYVRNNDINSPQYLSMYHNHLYDFLLELTPMVRDGLWLQIDTYWLEVGNKIHQYFKQRNIIPNKKIPFEIIRALDALFRVALLMQQKQGMGVRLQRGESDELDSAIERAITGTPTKNIKVGKDARTN